MGGILRFSFMATRKPTIALVGPGNLGTALVLALRRAGYRITELVARPASLSRARALARRIHAKAAILEAAALNADVTFVSVGDTAIAGVGAQLAAGRSWKGKVVLHTSGALGSRELAPLRKAGAAIGSAHPMMSFVRGVEPAWDGVQFALEGDERAVAAARQIARGLGCSSFVIPARSKPLYHALGAFASPMIVAQLSLAENVAVAAGLSAKEARRAIVPILRQTISNYQRGGPAAAFSGPFKRGDVQTIRRHLRELRKVPQARAAYLVLGREALRSLEVRRRQEIEALLAAEG